jgi:F-type H+-transporting ATPase subunit b
MQFLTIFGSSSGLGALGVDGQAFIIQLITFILAYLVLRRYAFGPILKVLKERRETIDSGVRLGEEMKKEKAALEEKMERELHKMRQEADAIIADAQSTARDTIRDEEEKARAKAKGVLAAAHDQIEQETNRARISLQKELVGLVSDATEAIIYEKMDSKTDTALIERALKDRQLS